MRLDKLTIGSAKASPTHQFKNLKDVTIDFDQEHWVTVVIGWNGTGKSNVLEALAIIFRDLIGKKRTPEFAFKLAYRMGSGDTTRHIHIDADPDREKDPFIIHIATDAEARGVGTLISFIEGEEHVSALRGRKIKFTTFLAEDESNLPRYVFSYYSGESTRMHEVFRPYLETYDGKLRNGEDPGLKRLFYAMPMHSQFVLLAFLIQQTDAVRVFLDEHLGLDPKEGVESVLFVLRQPPWKSKAPDGDPRFWNARGLVRDFISRLYDIALAPVKVKRRVPVSLWNEKELQFQYLYVKDIEALRKLVGNHSPASFFRDLESTYVSELIEEVRIRVRLKKNDGTVTFRELSEGEQQLLTVLGLLRFTSENESLFLLDEPDTHLNPRWCADYLKYLQDFVGQDEKDSVTSHIVLTTHNPLAIAELVKQQVQILKRDEESRQVSARKPELDPRGMGYAGIVTSDMFGLASALDTHTQELLEEKRLLTLKEQPLSNDERERLGSINLELEGYGFKYSMRDPLYEEYLRARYSADENRADDEKITLLPSAERRKKAKELIQKAAKKVHDEEEGEENAAN
jgi:predicted ATPase